MKVILMFCIFISVFSYAQGNTITKAYAYPNPLHISSGTPARIMILYNNTHSDVNQADVKVEIFSINGRSIWKNEKTLTITTGTNTIGSIYWNGSDYSGNTVFAGVYFGKISINAGELTTKIIKIAVY